MNTETLKAILNAFNCASTDPMRHNMACVSLQVEGENVVIAATDGAILSEVQVHDKALAELMDGHPFVIQHEDKTALKLLLKVWKTYSEIPAKREGEKIILGSEFQTGIVTARTLGINFPDYKSLFQYSTEPVLTIGLDASLLLNLAKSLKMEKHQGGRVKLTLRGNKESVHVTMGDQAMGLIMPCRIK